MTIYGNQKGIKALSPLEKINRGSLVEAGSLGTAGASTITLREFVEGNLVTAELTLASFVLKADMEDGADGANLAFGAKIYTVPAGAHTVVESIMDIALTAGGTKTDTPDVGLGSVIGSGAQTVLSGVGATSEDYLTGQTFADVNGTRTSVAANTVKYFASGGVKDVFLNAADGWHADIEGSLTATGKIIIKYIRA